jgi:hypothetical protein
LIEGGAGNGKERKAHGEKTGHQVSQPAEKAAEGQNPGTAGQEEVKKRTCPDQGCSCARRLRGPVARSFDLSDTPIPLRTILVF